MRTNQDDTTPAFPDQGTVIPGLGLTVRQAVETVQQLLEQHEVDESVAAKWLPMIDQILQATPRTLDDTLAILDQILCPSTGLPTYTEREGKLDVGALERIRAFLLGVQAAAQRQKEVGLADMVAAFVDAAPAMIAVPAAPADKLLEASAAAAGISAEQARVFYESMMGAFQAGRAA